MHEPAIELMPSTAANPADALAALRRLLLAIDTAAMAETLTKHQAAVMRAMVGSCDYATGETRLSYGDIAKLAVMTINGVAGVIDELKSKSYLIVIAQSTGKGKTGYRIDFGQVLIEAQEALAQKREAEAPEANSTTPSKPPVSNPVGHYDDSRPTRLGTTGDVSNRVGCTTPSKPPVSNPVGHYDDSHPTRLDTTGPFHDDDDKSPPKPPPTARDPNARSLLALLVGHFPRKLTHTARTNLAVGYAERLHRAATGCVGCTPERAIAKVVEHLRAIGKLYIGPGGFTHATQFVGYVVSILEDWSENGVPDDDSHTGRTIQGSTGTGSAAAQRPRARSSPRPASPSLAAATGGTAPKPPIKYLGPKPAGA